MKNTPTEVQLATISGLYESESIPTEDKIIHCHFQIGNCHWFIVEFDQVDTMFGFCILNGDLEMAEWGYIGFGELKSIKIQDIYEVAFDINWVPTPAGEVELIRKGGGIFLDTDSGPDGDPWV